MPPFVIHWFRRDLRLTDNTALSAASTEARGNVLPVFIQSEWHGEHRWTGSARQQFLCGALNTLANDLERHGSRLIIRRGDAVAELERLVHETRPSAIHFNRDVAPYGRRVEEQLEALARQWGIRVQGFTDVTLFPPESILTRGGTPFKVFTPYAKEWLKRLGEEPPNVRAPKLNLRPPPSAVASLPLPSLRDWGLKAEADILTPGEPAARARMLRFFREPIYSYRARRDFPGDEATSRFSADLRWGTLSIRDIVNRCHKASQTTNGRSQRQSVLAFLTELIWREFFIAVLWHHPEVLDHEFQPPYRGMPWLWPGRKAPHGALRNSRVDADEAFRRWQEGSTGFPIVDAGMRQLRETGFMHNRVRMIVAMFLTKDLHLDWRLGERYFMQKLVDGEIASNNGGWQWSAGTGADAAPYFRIQNPWTQTASFDPDGRFIKRWLPELRDVPPSALSKPPKAGERLARDYPPPLVDHRHERLITLEHFKETAAKHRL